MHELVGREHELRRLYDDVSADSCRLVLVRGAAGIGKTSLVTAAADVLSSEGRHILVGRCLPMTTVMPLLPVAEAVRTSARAVDEVPRLPLPAQAELARLLPDLAASGCTASTASGESAEERFRLFGALRQLLAQLPDAVLVLDDLHWSDSATLDFLNYLTWTAACQNSLRVVATMRTDEPAPLLRDWLREAATRPEVRDQVLLPLGPEATSRQITLLLGSGANAVSTEEVFRRSEGNPFFTAQLATAVASDAPAFLPHAVAALLRRRLAELSPAAQHVSAASAVLHRSATEEELAQVTGVPPSEVRNPLKELLRRKLLLPAGEGYSLQHALLAEVILEDLLTVERCELHGRAAEVLAARAVPSAAEVACHFRAAGRPIEELGWALRSGNERQPFLARRPDPQFFRSWGSRGAGVDLGRCSRSTRARGVPAATGSARGPDRALPHSRLAECRGEAVGRAAPRRDRRRASRTDTPGCP